MAVALATLPLNSLAADDVDPFFVSGLAGAALWVGLAGTGLARLAALPADFFSGVAATCDSFADLLATPFPTSGFFTTATLELAFRLAAAFPDTVFVTAGLLAAAFFATTFFTAAFFATALAAVGFGDFPTTFLPAVPPAEGFGTAFFSVAVLPGFLATAFWGVTLLPALTSFPAALATLLVGGFLLTTAFGLPVLTSFVLTEALPFCALAAVELRVVFAISLTVFWPWRPGVIAQVIYTSKPDSGILAYPHAVNCFGNVNLS